MNNSLITDMHQRKLLKKWRPILEAQGATPINSETEKIALAQLLENTHKFMKSHMMLNEAGIKQADIVGGWNNDGVLKGTGIGVDNNKDFYLPNIVIPMLRRIMPDLIANDLVAVQPLNGPVGYALAYRPVYGEKGYFESSEQKDDGSTYRGKEIGYAPTDTGWTGKQGVTATNEFEESGWKAPDNANGYWSAYLGTSISAGTWTGTGYDLGETSEYANIDQNYPLVSFGLVKTAVEAKTRKLAAHWSPELAEDMQIMHGIDVEREMVNTITFEVGAEIDRQIITEMVKAAITGGSVSTWDPSKSDGLDQMGRLATLLTQITIEANQIAIRTRRGNANFVVTTPRVCALLQQLSMNKFTTLKSGAVMPTVPDTGVGALTKVGLINDDQQLLVRDAYANAASDYVLMGYKGRQAGDSGIIYCPYIPLQLNKVLQPGTFTPSIGCRTRYGIMSNPWDAKNFYHFMRITGLTTTYNGFSGERTFIARPSNIKVTPTTGFDYDQTTIGSGEYPESPVK